MLVAKKHTATESTPLPAQAAGGYAAVHVEKERLYEGGMETEGNWCNDWGFLLLFTVCSGLLVGTGVKGLQDKFDNTMVTAAGCVLCALWCPATCPAVLCCTALRPHPTMHCTVP